MTVLLVTCAALPDGEDGGGLLLDALDARGIAARWVVWDDGGVPWQDADLVLVRSPWDYMSRLEEFLAWARKVEAAAPLVNPAPVLEWNTDKRYLLELAAAGLPVVPTRTADTAEELHRAVAALGTAVVKPRVGASGVGVTVVDAPERLAGAPAGPWVVQPLLASIRDAGETSVFVLVGAAVSALSKLPGPGEIRVQEEYGGRTVPVPLDAEATALAERAVRCAEDLLDQPLPYARVDLMRMPDGSLVVSELEVTEPGLYLDVLPENAPAFAAMVAGLLKTPPRAGT